MRTIPSKTIHTVLVSFAIGASLIVGGAGCCTIVSGTTQKVKISSVPDCANVKIERLTGVQSVPYWEGKTPTTAKLRRKDSYLATISLEGYERAEIPIEYGSMNGWIWGNIVFGGLIGLVVDGISGAAANLKPDEVRVELVALRAASTEQKIPVYAVLLSKDSEGRVRAQALPLNPTITK